MESKNILPHSNTANSSEILKNVDFSNPNLASQFHQKLVQIMNEFDSQLDHEHAVGIRLVSFGQTINLHVSDIGYYNPSLIRFYGRMESGAYVELIQHVSQISFLLMAVKRLDPEQPKEQIGFISDNTP